MPLFASSNSPGPVSIRPGERAFRVAEELALEQLARDCGAVHGNEPARTTWAQRMNGAGDSLLPSSRITEDQHRRVADGDPMNELGELSHRRRAPDHTRQHFVLTHLAAELFREVGRRASERSQHDEARRLGVERLGEVVVGAEPERLDRRVERREGGHENELRVRSQTPAGSEDFDPVDIRHLEVAENDVEVFRLELRDCVATP